MAAGNFTALDMVKGMASMIQDPKEESAESLINLTMQSNNEIRRALEWLGENAKHASDTTKAQLREIFGDWESLSNDTRAVCVRLVGSNGRLVVKLRALQRAIKVASGSLSLEIWLKEVCEIGVEEAVSALTSTLLKFGVSTPKKLVENWSDLESPLKTEFLKNHPFFFIAYSDMAKNIPKLQDDLVNHTKQQHVQALLDEIKEKIDQASKIGEELSVLVGRYQVLSKKIDAEIAREKNEVWWQKLKMIGVAIIGVVTAIGAAVGVVIVAKHLICCCFLGAPFIPKVVAAGKILVMTGVGLTVYAYEQWTRLDSAAQFNEEATALLTKVSAAVHEEQATFAEIAAQFGEYKKALQEGWELKSTSEIAEFDQQFGLIISNFDKTCALIDKFRTSVTTNYELSLRTAYEKLLAA